MEAWWITWVASVAFSNLRGADLAAEVPDFDDQLIWASLSTISAVTTAVCAVLARFRRRTSTVSKPPMSHTERVDERRRTEAGGKPSARAGGSFQLLVSASTDKRNPVIRSHNSSPQVAAAA